MNDTGSFLLKDRISNSRYLIHDNGGRPFKVVCQNQDISIYRHPVTKTTQKTLKYSVLVKSITSFLGYWSGFDTSENQIHGNSILIKISKRKYLYVGSRIYSFSTIDEIIDYTSYVHFSDVPCPVAYGTHFLYFMSISGEQFVKKKEFKTPVLVKNSMILQREFHTNKNLTKIAFKDYKLIVKRRYNKSQ